MRSSLAVSFLLTVACAGGSPPTPRVSSVTPPDGATGVALESPVALQFSEPMSCAATRATFTLTSAAGPVMGSVACAGSELVFTPSGPLAVSTDYLVNVDHGAKALEGGVLAAGFQSHFTTGTPMVTRVQPAAGATGVALGTPVAVQFWESMDCATVHAGSVHLVSAQGDVPSQIGCTGPAASVIPTSLLAPATTYTLLVSSGVRDRAGNPLAAYHASFTTAPLTPLPDSVVPDQDVVAMALSEDERTIYLGGSFNSVGPRTGSFVPIDAGTARALPGHPLVDGHVNACAPDGAGGWFIGGQFRRVGEVSRSNIAHLAADGRLDLAWNPGVNGDVTALAVDGNTLYVGGDFTMAGGRPRAGLAALEVSTGGTTEWDPAPTLIWGRDYSFTVPSIAAIAVSGTSVYIGGSRGLNAVSAVTGSPPEWSLQSHDVTALAVSGSTLYVGGTILADPIRQGLFAVDASTGTLTAWAPTPAGGAYYIVQALAVSGSTIIAGGAFSSIGGKARNGLAAIDAVTGVVTDWDPGLVPLDRWGIAKLPTVQSLGLSGSLLYVAGHFTAIGSQPRLGLGAIDLASGAPTAWNPGPAMGIQTLCVSGTTVSAGGSFYTLGGQPRSGLAAIDAETGALTTWDPNAGVVWGSDQGVATIVVSGSTVYVGGPFITAGGQVRSGLAALDATTGAATSWDPRLSAGATFLGHPGAYSIAVSGSTVYVGGEFSEVGGQPRKYLAALDAATGVATSWDPSAANLGFSLGMKANALIVDGAAVHIVGKVIPPEEQGVATIDATTGLVLRSTSLLDPLYLQTAYARTAAISGATLYVAGRFSSLGTTIRNNLAALDTTSGSVTAWDPDLNLSSSGVAEGWSLAVHGPVVYVGGRFDLVGGHRRRYLAALDAVTGAATAWDPGPSDGAPWAILATDTRVYVGGFGSSIGGETRGGFAILRP